MSEFAERIKDNVRGSAKHLTIFMVRLLTGSLLGVTLALITQNLTNPPIGTFLFMFIAITTIGVVLRITRYWSLAATVILLLVLVLIGVLLKLYIHTAATA
jgi:fatty-acid desaturase